jgi:hypothetical protein
MVAVYGSFGEVEAARPARDGFKKYAGALAGAWAVLFVATVMIIGTSTFSLQFPGALPLSSLFEQSKKSRLLRSVFAGTADNQESVLLQAPTQMLAFKEFEPETNVFENFDAE